MKDHEDEPEPRFSVERSTPYYVSTEGLERLRREGDTTTDTRRRAEVEGMIAAAVVVEPPADRKIAGYLAKVTVAEDGAKDRAFTLVGDDEADVKHGLVGMSSPLAQALAGSRVGSKVVWHRPAGDTTLRVRSIEYPGR
jgi:transcription elongation GreA/GreB family factor